MTQITSPDGEVLDARSSHDRPRAGTLPLFGIDARWDIKVDCTSNGTVTLNLGTVVVLYPNGPYGDVSGQLAETAAIGRAITAQAEALLDETAS